MYKAMRRKDRAISQEEALELLERNEYGMLSTVGEDGQPYVVPLSYVLMDGQLYFHCAQVGQKIDNIVFCPRVCFCAVGATQPVYDGGFSTYFESVLVYGSARNVDGAEEKRRSLMLLAEKYLPEHMDKAEGDITKSFQRTAVYAISIDHISGKAKRKKMQQGD